MDPFLGRVSTTTSVHPSHEIKSLAERKIGKRLRFGFGRQSHTIPTAHLIKCACKQRRDRQRAVLGSRGLVQPDKYRACNCVGCGKWGGSKRRWVRSDVFHRFLSDPSRSPYHADAAEVRPRLPLVVSCTARTLCTDHLTCDHCTVQESKSGVSTRSRSISRWYGLQRSCGSDAGMIWQGAQ